MNLLDILLRMSLQASILIVVVLVIRLFIKKLPKIYTCFLWGLVLLRLLCPVFIESSFSLVPQMDSSRVVSTEQNQPSASNTLPGSSNGNTQVNEATESNEEPTNTNPIYYPSTSSTAVDHTAQSTWDLEVILIAVVMIGIAIMSIVHIIQYVRIKHLLRTAVIAQDGAWECDRIHSPFVMGCIQPRIYLPFGIFGSERTYIVHHERCHIRHFDPQLRILQIIALCLHWWNPLVWLAVYLMNQDREMFCDEAVLKHADINAKKEYSQTLLNFAMKQSKLAIIVSFGETNTESRIKHIMKFRKPKLVLSILLILIIGLCASCFLTVPGKEGNKDLDPNTNDVTVTPQISPQPTTEPTPAVIEEEPADTTKLNKDEFIQLVMKYLGDDNKSGFASLIKYPIKLRIDDQEKVMQSEEDFLLVYDQIITQQLKSLVLATSNKIENMYGVGLGNGSLWLETFDEAGYQIYAINNASELTVPENNALKDTWDTLIAQSGISAQESETWYARLIKDIPYAEGSYNLRGIYYEDLDNEGTKDLAILLSLKTGAITTDDYPKAYLGFYMNEDAAYVKELKDGNFYMGFRQLLTGDIDNDENAEIICSLDTGGNGGNGSVTKYIFKYKENSLVPMSFPRGDLEGFEDMIDEGYVVNVLYGKGDNKYKAVCDELGQTVEFNADNALDSEGNKIVHNMKEDEVAGGNTRGFTSFDIISKNGREYLIAKEYLHGEAGIAHQVGWATFLLDWDKDGTPLVLEFGVEQ
ncbi:MAG: M56 family metallopeptidase [Mobilitalea sp.]